MNLITDTIYRMLPSVRPASHCRGETRAQRRREPREAASTSRIAAAMKRAMPHLLARGKVLDDRRAALAQQLRAWAMKAGGKR